MRRVINALAMAVVVSAGFSATEALAQSGVKNLAIVTPGFAADCLETLEEIAVQNS